MGIGAEGVLGTADTPSRCSALHPKQGGREARTQGRTSWGHGLEQETRPQPSSLSDIRDLGPSRVYGSYQVLWSLESLPNIFRINPDERRPLLKTSILTCSTPV